MVYSQRVEREIAGTRSAFLHSNDYNMKAFLCSLLTFPFYFFLNHQLSHPVSNLTFYSKMHTKNTFGLNKKLFFPLVFG